MLIFIHKIKLNNNNKVDTHNTRKMVPMPLPFSYLTRTHNVTVFLNPVRFLSYAVTILDTITLTIFKNIIFEYIIICFSLLKYLSFFLGYFLKKLLFELKNVHTRHSILVIIIIIIIVLNSTTSYFISSSVQLLRCRTLPE